MFNLFNFIKDIGSMICRKKISKDFLEFLYRYWILKLKVIVLLFLLKRCFVVLREIIRFLILILKLFRICIKYKIVLLDVKLSRVYFCVLWILLFFSNVELFLFLIIDVLNELYVFFENLIFIFGNKRGYVFNLYVYRYVLL